MYNSQMHQHIIIVFSSFIVLAFSFVCNNYLYDCLSDIILKLNLIVQQNDKVNIPYL